MSGFVESENRLHATMMPERFDDYTTEDNSVRWIDVFIDLLGFYWEEIQDWNQENSQYSGNHSSTLLRVFTLLIWHNVAVYLAI